MNGILLGIVDGDGEPRIAIKVGGADTVLLHIGYAQTVWEQLGGLLDTLSPVDDDEDEDEDGTSRTVN